MKKIAHINYLPTYLPGIHNKLIEQAHAATALGIPIDYFLLNTKEQDINGNIKQILLNTSKNKFISAFQKKYLRYKYIQEYVSLQQYDYLILRYPLAMGFAWKKFYKKYGHKIITEHHTIEETQLKTFFSSKMLSGIVAYLESINKRWLLKQILGHIGVTEEIVEHNKNISANANCAVITNGYTVGKVPKYKIPKNNQVFSFLFVASRFAPWHGLDRVLKGAQLYRGTKPITLYIVGSVVNKQDQKMLHNFQNDTVKLITPGALHGEQLDNVFSLATIAISSLALHRIQMNEACVLKTREYMARGIPFIYAYDDPDLTGSETFALKIKKDDSPVNLEKIIEIYNKELNDECLADKERQYAINTIDWKIKLKELYEYITKIN